MQRPRSADPSEAALDVVFLLAGTVARRSALHERVRAELARTDFDGLSAALVDRRLLTLIGSRALEAGPDLCPPEFRDRVECGLRLARARALSIESETRSVVSRLAGEGIAALPLKGPLLAQEAHGDVGLRETDDVDLLVLPQHLERARCILVEDGYSDPSDPVRPNGLPDIHFAFKRHGRPSVELHWRVHWYEERFSQEMLERAKPGDDGLLRAEPQDLVAALLLFYARDGFHGLRLAADVAAWWDRHGDRMEPRFLEHHARHHPELRSALTAAATAVRRLTGAPAEEWLGAAPARGRRVELAARLADWTQAGDRDQLAANMSLVDGLLTPAGTTHLFARRHLVPRSGATLPHAVKILARWAAGLWQLRGGRRWTRQPAT